MIGAAQVSASRFYSENEPSPCLLTLMLTTADSTNINAFYSKEFPLSISVDGKIVLTVHVARNCQHLSAAVAGMRLPHRGFAQAAK